MYPTDSRLERATSNGMGGRLRTSGMARWLSLSILLALPAVVKAQDYNLAYKKQARTRPVTYGAWAVMTPVNGAPPVNGEMTITQQVPYDGLWLLGMPANRNRLYTVYQSDDDGATWTPNVSLIRATANYLMWLDTDEGAPADRLYRVMDAGM